MRVYQMKKIKRSDGTSVFEQYSFYNYIAIATLTFSLSVLMMGWSGLISMCFLAAIYPIVLVSLSACAFIILSVLADQPY